MQETPDGWLWQQSAPACLPHPLLHRKPEQCLWVWKLVPGPSAWWGATPRGREGQRQPCIWSEAQLPSVASSPAPFRSTMPLLLLTPPQNRPSGASNTRSLFILHFYLQKHRITLLNKNSDISDTNRISQNMYQNKLMKRCSPTSTHCNQVNFSLILRLFFPQGLILKLLRFSCLPAREWFQGRVKLLTVMPPSRQSRISYWKFIRKVFLFSDSFLYGTAAFATT